MIRRLAGVVGVVLGVVGLIACVAAIVGVWSVVAWLKQLNAEVHAEIDAVMIRVEERTEEARSTVREARGFAAVVDELVRDSAVAIIERDDAVTARLDQAERRIDEAIQQAESVIQVSADAVELLDRLQASLRQQGLIEAGSGEAPTALDDIVQAGRRTLAEASGAVDELKGRLDHLGRKPDDVDLAAIARLALNIVAQLDVVDDSLRSFSRRLEKTRDGLQRLHDKLGRWIHLGAVILTLLLVWIGAGQCCLAAWGWRLVRD